MPELPEVEVTRRSVAGGLLDARVLEVRMGLPLRWPLGREPHTLAGCVCGDIARRGKYLWLPLSRGVDESTEHLPGLPAKASTAAGGLLIHLGMSGALSFGQAPLQRAPHEHFRLVTDRGDLWLIDPRRFGAVVWSTAVDAGPAARLLGGLGLEPFDAAFTGAHLHAALQRRRVAVKTALLAGDIVVGAGNIYACEALFAAGIDPRTRSDAIGRLRAERLATAIRATLSKAVALGGSTLRDFRDAHGLAGAFQAEAAVYGRAGLPCLACATPIRRIVQAQRSTFFCPRCQRR